MPRSLSAVVLPGDPTTALQSGTRQYIDAAVALKATDTAVVHLAGTETVSGTKIFSAPPQVAQGTLAYHPVRFDDTRLTADQVAATASIRTLGTGSQQAAAGTDARFVPTGGSTGQALVKQSGSPNDVAWASAPSQAPPGASPASILNIGPRLGQTHFSAQLARLGDSAYFTKSTLDLAAGYEESPIFTTTTDKQYVIMNVSVGAPVTGGATSARAEMREQDQTGADMAFDATDAGTHYAQGVFRIHHAPAVLPDTVCAQLHNGSSDRISIRTQLVSGTWRLRIRFNGSTVTLDAGGTDIAVGIANIQDIDWAWKIQTVNGKPTVWVGDLVTPKYTGATAFTSTGGPTWYHKSGCYLQTTTASDTSTDYGEVWVKSLVNWHTGWTTPAKYWQTPQHAATHGIGSYDQIMPTSLLGVGTDGYVLTADSTQALGLKWAASSAAGAELTVNKGAASGYAGLDATSKVPFAQLPSGASASQVAIGSHTHAGSGGYVTGTVASGSTTPTVVHNLGTRAVAVIIQEVSTGLIVPVAVETVDGTGTGSTSTIRLTFTTAPTTGQYSYLVLAGAPVSAQAVPIPPSTLVDAATIATDASLSTHFRLGSMAGDRTLGIPTNPTDGQRNLWEITADSTQRVLTFTQGATDAFEATTSAPNSTLTIPGTKTGLVAAVYSLARRRWTVLAMAVTI